LGSLCGTGIRAAHIRGKRLSVAKRYLLTYKFLYKFIHYEMKMKQKNKQKEGTTISPYVQ